MLDLIVVLTGLLAGPVPVVVSTDVGCEMDDQWALAHMVLSPSIHVRAIVTAHSPGQTASQSALVARSLLDQMGPHQKPPVVEGSSSRLVRRSLPNRNPGVDRLLGESAGFTPLQPLTIVVLGPATDVASAILLDPRFAERVVVVAMAFDSYPEGGDPFNVRNDTLAWQILAESSTPITIATGDVLKRDLTLTRDQARARFGGLGKRGETLVQIQSDFLGRSPETARRVTGSPDAWPVWDEGPVAVLLGWATIDTSPRFAIRDDARFDRGRASGSIRRVTRIDSERLWADLALRLRPAP